MMPLTRMLCFTFVVTLILILLSGCGTVKVGDTKIPVHVTCSKKKLERPNKMFGQGTFLNSGEAAKAILLDFLALEKYVGELEVELAGCQ